MKNLENYGVLEMDTREIRETEGGWFWLAVSIVYMAESIYTGVRDGIREGAADAA